MIQGRRRGAMICVLAFLLAATVLPSATAASGSTPTPPEDAARAAATERPDRVLLFTLPATTWSDITDADTPALDELVDDGAVAALSGRTAARSPDPSRGYLTLGAGNRAFVGIDDPKAHLAFPREAPYEGGTAATALARRTGHPAAGGIVHLGIAYLEDLQDLRLYGAEVGAFGEELRTDGLRRAVVSAADLSRSPTPASLRRSPVLGLVDRRGTVDTGTLQGLLREDPRAPYGVRADPDAFTGAVADALERADVVLAEPGDTLRADEFAPLTTPDQATELSREALENTDALLGRVRDLLGPRDLLLVLGSSAPVSRGTEHLLPIVAHGQGVDRGWLTAPSTRQPGQVTLVDVAPTVLRALGAERPSSMTGTPMRSVPAGTDDRVPSLIELDASSRFRESFAQHIFFGLGGLLTLVAVATFAVLLWRPARRFLIPLSALAYLGIAIFPAAHIARALEMYRFGEAGAHLVLWGLAVVLAAGAYALPGPRWGGGVALMLLTTALFAADALLGGPLQVNGVFGHSPLVAGRFYGLSNPGHAILYAAGLLGVLGYVELGRRTRAPWWTAVVLTGLVLAVGLPTFGANFGGFIAGIAAVAAAFTLARRWRIRWRWVLAVAVAALALAALLTIIDLARPPEMRTHLGRFAELVAAGGPAAFDTVVRRKLASTVGSLVVVRWTYLLPVGLAVVGLLLRSPKSPLKTAISSHPMIRAALVGSGVAALVGFAVNDSGIAIPAIVLGHVVPFLVLMTVESLLSSPSRVGASDRRPGPGTAPGGHR